MLKDNFIIIGAGKIASSIVASLILNNYKVDCVISKNLISAKTLASKNKIKFYTNSLKDIPREGIYFLSVPDDQIEKTAKAISKQKINFSQSLFIHLSGSLNISALESLKKKGANTASMHIMQTFPSKEAVKIQGSFAAIESESIVIKKYLFSLARKLGLKPFQIDSENKIDYHIAGVYASNFLIANLFNSQKELVSSKINNPVKILKPIITATLKNVERYGIEKALSGPVERGDFKLVKKHLECLKKKKDKTLLQSYIAQSFVLLDVVDIKLGKSNPGHKKIKTLLEKYYVWSLLLI